MKEEPHGDQRKESSECKSTRQEQLGVFEEKQVGQSGCSRVSEGKVVGDEGQGIAQGFVGYSQEVIFSLTTC